MLAGFRVSSNVAKWYKDPSCQRDKADLRAGGQFSSKVMAKEAVSEHLVPEMDKNCNKVCLVSSSMSALIECMMADLDITENVSRSGRIT